MSARRFKPASFGREVRQQLRGLIGHPRPGVEALDPVLAVGERDLGGDRRSGLSVRHGGQRTPLRLAAALALLCAALIPAASLTAPAAHAADDKTTFTVGLLNEVDSFNPFTGIEAESYEMWALTYDYMITYSMKDSSPQPGLAESWETSDDGLTWTFKIREGVKWSDGEPLTASDIAYTYNRVLNGTTESASWASYLNGVSEITAPDDTTVVLKLDKPNAVLPLLPIPIVPEHIWKDVSEKEVKAYSAAPKDGQPVVGSGPFRLVEGTAGGQTYRFEANPDYWQGAPHVDEVVFRVYKNEDAMVQALIKGEIDFAEDISAIQVDALKGQDGITAHMGNTGGFNEIAFNTGSVDTATDKPIGDPNPAVFDKNFRHALGYAINLDQIVDKVYMGAGVAGSTVVPPMYSRFHWDPPEDQAITYDPDKAAELLDAAGYKVGADGFLTMPDGSPIGTLRLAARSDSETSLNTMKYVQEYLADVDIDSKVETFESSKLTSVILDGDFDMFEWGWYVEPDPDSILSYFTCGQRGNWSDSWYCNPEYDALYESQHSEVDPAKREETVKKMQEMLYADSPYLVTAYWSTGEAVRTDRFACFQPQPDPGGVWLIQYGIHNYLSVRPADEAGDCDGVTTAVRASADDKSGEGGGGISTGALIGTAAVAVGALAVGGVFMMRRRGTTEDRE